MAIGNIYKVSTEVVVMAIETKSLQIRILVCPKCGFEWRPRLDRPKVCPRCKTYLKWEESKE
jgi:predicted Zn-ribbon and HTH transcriptional regulator